MPHEADPRLAAIEDQIIAIAGGDLSARGTPTGEGDELDAIIAGLNMLAEDFQERERQRLEAERDRQALSEKSEHLLKVNEALAEFAYVASHDLQEPLRMVSSFTQLLEKKYAPQLDDTARRYIHFAVDGANRMRALITDLLQYSRVGEHAMHLSTCDTSAVLQEIGAMFAAQLGEIGGSLHIDILPTINVDRDQFSRVMQNLIGNAIKYRADRPLVIHVESWHRRGYWHFVVRDNGIGFEQRHADRILGVFQRLHTQDRYPGTGIGLAICRKIVEAHGGKLWATAVPDRGATFHFTLADSR